MSNFVQFELWRECKQGCKFCCIKGVKPVNKDKSCQYTLNVLNKMEPNKYDYIGIIGGEFFNGEIEGYQTQFYDILRKIIKLNPKKVFIATTLIYDLRKYLIPTLKMINKELNALDKIVICTSWDKKYRFHNENEYNLWARNMLYLGNKYPSIGLHTEIILTQYFIDSIINEEWNLALFKSVFRTEVDFIEPSSGLYYKDKFACQNDIPGFFPTRSSFIKFINKVRDQIDLDTFLSMELRSDELYFLDENNEEGYIRDRRQLNGKVNNTMRDVKYDIGLIDSEEPMRDIVLRYKEMFEEV